MHSLKILSDYNFCGVVSAMKAASVLNVVRAAYDENFNVISFVSFPGLAPRPFSRSNPVLRQEGVKARFLREKIFDRGIKSEAVYAAKAKSPTKAGRIFLRKTCGQPECTKGADLAFGTACQDLRTGRDRRVFSCLKNQNQKR